MANRKYDFAKTIALLEDLRSERSEWEAEWRLVSDYLLPGRGIYQTYSKPRKRRLTSSRVVNATAEDALYVLTSGMHGGLTSPSRPWFRLEWRDPMIQSHEVLKAWLQDCTERLHTELQRSNFYSMINSFYIEYAGFGNGSIYVGSDTMTDDVAFWFHLLTAGEYYVAMGPDGLPDTFIRTIFATPKQVYDKYGARKVSDFIKQQVEDRRPSMHETYITLIELVVKEKFQDKPWTRYVFEGTNSGPTSGQPILTDIDGGTSRDPLELNGFYEFPYPFARWGTIGSDVYGIGPGARSVNDIKRLQEIEKAALMATHKSVDPPLNIPVRMKGRVNQLPGGYNYYSNPNEMVTELYRVQFDIQGAGYMMERIENRLKQNFFNDIFLTSARDPNASPLKATQVEVQEQEILRREKELEATVKRPADAERYRIQAEAAGQAEAEKAKGLAEAEVIRAQGDRGGHMGPGGLFQHGDVRFAHLPESHDPRTREGVGRIITHLLLHEHRTDPHLLQA